MKTISINGKEAESTNNDGLTYCIIRTYSAGVWAGFIEFPSEIGGIVYQARRLYKWDSQFTLSELAKFGVRDPENVKFATRVEKVGLTQIIEVIPCTHGAEESLESIPDYIA